MLPLSSPFLAAGPRRLMQSWQGECRAKSYCTFTFSIHLSQGLQERLAKKTKAAM
jgi:hypothetical protein